MTYNSSTSVTPPCTTMIIGSCVPGTYRLVNLCSLLLAAVPERILSTDTKLLGILHTPPAAFSLMFDAITHLHICMPDITCPLSHIYRETCATTYSKPVVAFWVETECMPNDSPRPSPGMHQRFSIYGAIQAVILQIHRFLLLSFWLITAVVMYMHEFSVRQAPRLCDLLLLYLCLLSHSTRVSSPVLHHYDLLKSFIIFIAPSMMVV